MLQAAILYLHRGAGVGTAEDDGEGALAGGDLGATVVALVGAPDVGGEPAIPVAESLEGFAGGDHRGREGMSIS